MKSQTLAYILANFSEHVTSDVKRPHFVKIFIVVLIYPLADSQKQAEQGVCVLLPVT